MKNSKSVFLTTVLILTGLFSFAQEQETVTLVSSKNLKGASEVFVNLHGNIQTESWDKDYIRIVLEIKTNGVTREVVKHLISKKHFKIASFKNNQDRLQLSNPNIILPVYINGKRLKEEVSYLIFVPQNILVILNTEKDAADALAIAN